jgi:hypothetical protein
VVGAASDDPIYACELSAFFTFFIGVICSARYNLLVLAPNKNPAALADKNTELAVRLKISEEQNRLLREENQRLKQLEQSLQQIKGELEKTIERKVLLEEEVRWLKAQYYGRSTQSSDGAEQNADQQMLFNEAEVRGTASLDPHRTTDPRVLSVRASEDQRRAAYPPDLCVRRAARGADHSPGAARHTAQVNGEPFLARARHQIQV